VGHTRTIKKGQLVLYQGEAPPGAFLVKEGLVRALNMSSNGEEKTVALFAPGDYFPIGFIFDKSPVALFFYEAAFDSVIEVIDKAEFKSRLDRAAATDQLSSLATLYLSALLQVNALGQTKAKDRIARIMQFLCVRFGRSAANDARIMISIPLTQLDIARMAGLTRETTAVELNALKAMEIITVRRKTYYVNLKKLLASMDDDDLSSVVL